ncbi:hypothetical protein FRC17_002122 [Serendipita sp. 399]|nr:hypothetical protein FRC17_002122 [Serendipita sp. 399]
MIVAGHEQFADYENGSVAGLFLLARFTTAIQHHFFPNLPRRWRNFSFKQSWRSFLQRLLPCSSAQPTAAEQELQDFTQTIPEDFPAISNLTLPPYPGNTLPPGYSARRGSVLGALFILHVLTNLSRTRRNAASTHDVVLEVGPNPDQQQQQSDAIAIPMAAHLLPLTEPPPAYIVAQQEVNDHSIQTVILERTSHSIEDEWRSRRNLHE